MGFELEDGLPILPPKRFFYNKEKEFLFNRMKSLNEYLQALISMYEAIAHPTLQKFLEIDSKYCPNFEYQKIKGNGQTGTIPRLWSNKLLGIEY